MQKSSDSLKYESKNPIRNLLIEKFRTQLLGFIKLAKPGHILDAGCGEGYMLSFLDKQNADWHLEGFDITSELIDRAKKNVPNAALSVRDIYNCGYANNTFDLVIGTEVLEHLKDPERALSEIRRLTKRWAILSVPNEPLFALSHLFTGKDVIRLGNCKEHCNRWSAKSFVDLVRKYFKIHSVSKPFPWIMVLCEKLNQF